MLVLLWTFDLDFDFFFLKKEFRTWSFIVVLKYIELVEMFLKKLYWYEEKVVCFAICDGKKIAILLRSNLL